MIVQSKSKNKKTRENRRFVWRLRQALANSLRLPIPRAELTRNGFGVDQSRFKLFEEIEVCADPTLFWEESWSVYSQNFKLAGARLSDFRFRGRYSTILRQTMVACQVAK